MGTLLRNGCLIYAEIKHSKHRFRLIWIIFPCAIMLKCVTCMFDDIRLTTTLSDRHTDRVRIISSGKDDSTLTLTINELKKRNLHFPKIS